jgi:voltage-gated potassium channel
MGMRPVYGLHPNTSQGKRCPYAILFKEINQTIMQTMTTFSIRAFFFDVLEAEEPKNFWAKPLRIFLVAIILINITAVILESVKGLVEEYKTLFWVIEIVSVAIFTLEYLLRLWVVPEADSDSAQYPLRSRIYYVGRPSALVDLLAILPFYLSSILSIDLRMLRVLRLLRLLKLIRYFRGISILADVLRAEFIPLTSAMLVMFIIMIMAATGMYAAEQATQPETFGSIPAAMWWSIVTLTTVGYGDAVPMTLLGKVIGAIIMLLGIGMVALPAGMLASRFSDELHRRKQVYREEINKSLLDGKLSDAEAVYLKKLSDDLCISETDVFEISAKANQPKYIQSEHFCPHCGKELSATD